MIILVDPSFENLWTIKIILMDFELASRIGVNFYKSSLIEINVESSFLELTEDFLNCNIKTLSFRYLGFPVGINIHLDST